MDRDVRADIEEEDVEEAYYRYMEENPMAGVIQDDDDDFLEYDADGNPIMPDKKVRIDCPYYSLCQYEGGSLSARIHHCDHT